MRRLLWIVPLLAVAALAAWFLWRPAEPALPGVQPVTVVATLPHDSTAFTEGLFIQNGQLFESTGEEGSSGFRRADLQTGEILAQRDLPMPYFGEGIVGWKDRIVQLTWKDGKGFVYRASDFAPVGSFTYAGEGWGLTHDGRSIIMSDGTATLRFLDPDTMKPQRTLAVTAHGCPVAKLNELEWINGEIWANIWQSDLIARIDPESGRVTGFVDVSALGPPTADEDEVANGIAHDPATGKVYVTGKMWPQLYQVTLGSGAASGAANDAAAALMRCAG
jgi:glutaminyl-peptide cyclotransferase